MSYYGSLQLPTASKPLACRRGESCLHDGLIDKGEVYAHLARRQIVVRSPGLANSDYGEDREYEGAAREGKITKTWYRNLHLDCFEGWARYIAQHRKEWNEKRKKGRPAGTSALKELSPEERKERRRLVRRRAYLGQKILARTVFIDIMWKPTIELVELVQEYSIDIPNQLSVSLLIGESRQTDWARQRIAQAQDLVKCKKGKTWRPYCQPDRGSCLNCGRLIPCCPQQETVSGNLLCGVHS